MENKLRIRFLFLKYIQQTCTEKEQAELMAYISDTQNKKFIEQLMDEAFNEELPSLKLPTERKEQILDRIFETPAVKKAGIHTIKYKVAMLAAVLLITVVFAIRFYKPVKTAGPQLSSLKLHSVKATDEHQLIKLEDGSTVILNRLSTLLYSPHLGHKTREVTLIGEGYFNIRHESKRPFIVHSGKYNTIVLGTAFNIKSSDKHMSVTVTRGKVSVTEGTKVLGTILPNEQLNAGYDIAVAQKIQVKADKAIEWQSHDLFFDDVTMVQAAAILERHFGTKINFASNTGKNCRFTTTFLHGETLKQILEVITSFNNASFKQTTDHSILITGSGCE